MKPVLVVDDEQQIRLLVKTLLSKEGSSPKSVVEVAAVSNPAVGGARRAMNP